MEDEQSIFGPLILSISNFGKLGCAFGRIGSENPLGDPASSVSRPANSMASSFPSLNSPQRVGNVRNKVSLKPGHSLMDWIRLGNSGNDLQGFGGKFHKVSSDELARHNTEHDVWISIRGLFFYN